MTNISSIVKSARNIMRQDTGTGSDELRILQLGWMLFLKIFSDKDKEMELLQDDYTSPIPAELHWDEWAGDGKAATGKDATGTSKGATATGKGATDKGKGATATGKGATDKGKGATKNHGKHATDPGGKHAATNDSNGATGKGEGITGDELLHFVDQKLFPALANIDLSTGSKRAVLVREVFANNYNYMKSGIHLRQVINKLNEIDFNKSKDKHLFGQIYETFLSELQSAGTLGEFYTPRAITELLAELIAPQHGERVLDPACGTGGYLTAAIEHLKAKTNTVAEHNAIGKNVMGWEYKPLPYLLANTNLILHDISVPSIRYDDSLARPLSDYRPRDRVDVMLANPPFGGVVSDNNETNFPRTYRTKESADLFLILMIHLLKADGRAAIVLPDGSLTGDGVKERIRQKLLTDCNLHTIVRLPNSVFQPYASVATNLLFFTKGEPTKTVWYYQHQLPEGYKSYSKTKPIQLAEFATLKQWWNNREESEQAWQVGIEAIKADGYNLDIKNPHQPEEEKQHSSGELLDMLHQSFNKSDQLLAQLKQELLP